MKFETATPYIAAYVLFNKQNKYAFVKRANTSWYDGYYGLPAGKVEQNESVTQAAIREAKEEVGITLQASDLRQVLTSHRNEDGNQWIDVLFEVNSWEGEVINNEPDVHSELAWFSLDDLPENTIPSLRFMLEQKNRGVPYVEYGWTDK